MAVITDAITERTAGAGVTVDGLLIKDGLLPDVTPADIGAEAAGAAATAVSGHESTYDHSNIPGVDEAAALTAYQSALAVAAAGQLLTASGPGEAAFAAPAGGGASLSDYSNVIVVDAGGNGDYTTLSAAIAAATSGDLIYIFGALTEAGPITVTKAITIFGPGNHAVNVPITISAGGTLRLTGQTNWSNSTGITVSGGVLYAMEGITIAKVTGSTGQVYAQGCYRITTLDLTNSAVTYKIKNTFINTFTLSAAVGIGSNFCKGCIIGTLESLVGALANLPFTHCDFTNAPVDVGVAATNYSNISKGVTWPPLP